MVGSEINTANQQGIVQNVLRRMDRIDGGIGRQRWEKGNGYVSRNSVGEIKRVPARKSTAVQTPKPPSPPKWLSQMRSHTSHTSRMAGDGALSSSDDENGDCLVPLDSTIYVSILDPMGEPAFKPSPTKPIPSWMQWLPSQRNYNKHEEVQPRSILDEHFPPRSGPSSTKPQPEPKMICPTTRPQVPPRPTLRRISDYLRVRDGPESSNMADSTIKALKGPSFVLDEPLQRPSSVVNKSSSSSSRVAVEEPPTLPETLSPGSPSPYTPRKPSPLGRHEEKADGKDASWNAHPRPPSSPLTEQVVAPFQRSLRRTPPAQSREFLNLYRPARAGPSIAVAGREGGRAMDGGRQVRSILDGNHSPAPGGSGQAVTDGGDLVDLRSVRKRSSLQSELKKLLGGRGQGRDRDRG
ncbi:hypothetical protein F4818DRAFT_318843 [Hypoxylon cercidicola]|nr:hypothetical protein F4818DRAFT_318843 [Hypoxylon cercidicola]